MSEAKFTRGEWSAEFNGVYYDIESLNDGLAWVIHVLHHAMVTLNKAGLTLV